MTQEYVSGYLKEVLIENFMSHEYSRIKFHPGLNIITGPNGSGKSSILLAISIALGQSHTERSKKLSGLIRRGKEYALVSIVLDNSEVDGRKPFPSIRQDEVIISRVIRGDGQYPFQINYSPATRMEVRRLLNRAGINPDNMLIIMHQNMIEAFGFVDPKEKLIMFEEALGLSEYRERILDSMDKLRKITDEEETVKGFFDEANKSLVEWEKEYNKLLEKRRLEERLNKLYCELAWSKYHRVKSELEDIEARVDRLREDLHNENIVLMKTKNEIAFIESEYLRQVEDLMSIIHTILSMGYIGRESRGEWFDKVSRHIDEMNVLRKRYGSKRGLESVTQYKIELIEKTIRELEGRLEMLMGELREAELEASKYGERIYSGRGQHEIIADIRELRGKLESYRDIDDSIEATYNYYKGLYNELRKKLEKIRNDRLLAEKELSKRVSLWRVRIEEYIDRVSRIYNSILSRLNAEGYARVVNIDDVNEAGLHLFVGFGGLEPTVLDVYSQSGGERTTAAMAFLLALQQFVKSPFRAIDEFDVHMDPRNREIVLEYVVEMMRGRRDQYILITPGYISRELGDANIIVVQKIEGVTVPKVIGGSELVE